MGYKDYYAILGVAKDASSDEIQRAYRKLARQYHPDLNKASGAEDRFKEIGEAYEVLKDPEKRQKYDRFGMAWKAAQQSGGTPPPGYEDIWFDVGRESGATFTGFSGFSDFFEQLFGSGTRHQAAWGNPQDQQWEWAMPGTDQEASLTLSLEEAAHGGQREIALSDPHTGQTKTYMVTIPPGVQPRQRIRLAGQGAKGMDGGPAGDLYLRIELLPHARFRLDNTNLHTTLEVTPWEAALGSSVTLPTLNGAVQVKVPPGSSSGRKIRLKGKGFPSKQRGTGDLYAEIRIMVPKSLTAKERELFETLAAESSFQPRHFSHRQEV